MIKRTRRARLRFVTLPDSCVDGDMPTEAGVDFTFLIGPSCVVLGAGLLVDEKILKDADFMGEQKTGPTSQTSQDFSSVLFPGRQSELESRGLCLC